MARKKYSSIALETLLMQLKSSMTRSLSTATPRLQERRFQHGYCSIQGHTYTVKGIDMYTGAEKGFYGPTNKENDLGAKRANFLTTEKTERQTFEPKKPPKEWKDGHPPPPHSSSRRRSSLQCLPEATTSPFASRTMSIRTEIGVATST